MSNWARSPSRNLEPVEKMPDDSGNFTPELVSNSFLRQSTESSGYGKVVAQKSDHSLPEGAVAKPWEETPTFSPTINNDKEINTKVTSSGYGTTLPPKKEKKDPSYFEPTPTFKPELMSDPAIREKAKTSGYGKELPPPPKQIKQESPSFKPELVQSRTSVEWREKSSSSSYGTKVPEKPKKEDPSPSRDEFAPRLPQSSMRNSVQSSQYGTVVPKARPTSAPASPDKKDFVLDCVSSTNELNAKIAGKSVRTEKLREVSPVPVTQNAMKLRDNASSSGYGVTSPKQAPRPERPSSSPSFKHGSARNIISTPPPPIPKPVLTKEVNSTGYGSTYTPKKGELEERKDASPRFSAGKVTAKTFPDPTPPKRNEALLASVESKGYGSSYTPEKTEREEKEAKPVWRPNNGKHAFGAPDAAPRSKLNDSVQSYYGSDYEAVKVERAPRESTEE